MSTKKLMTLATLFTVVALAVMGVAYGFWADQLNINGTVNTAKFGVSFAPISQTVLPACPGVTYDGTLHNLSFTIDKAYPGYVCNAAFSVINTGDINATISQPTPADAYPWATFTLPSCYADGAVVVAHDGPQACTLHLSLNSDGSQVTPGGTYHFTFTIAANQAH